MLPFLHLGYPLIQIHLSAGGSLLIFWVWFRIFTVSFLFSSDVKPKNDEGKPGAEQERGGGSKAFFFPFYFQYIYLFLWNAIAWTDQTQTQCRKMEWEDCRQLNRTWTMPPITKFHRKSMGQVCSLAQSP